MRSWKALVPIAAAVLTLAPAAMVFDVEGASAAGHPSCADSWKARRRRPVVNWGRLVEGLAAHRG